MSAHKPRTERCSTVLCSVIAIAVMAWWTYQVAGAAQPVQVAAVSCEAATAGGAGMPQACTVAPACTEHCGVAALFRRPGER